MAGQGRDGAGAYEGQLHVGQSWQSFCASYSTMYRIVEKTQK